MIHEKKNGNVKLYICLAAALCAYLPTGVNMYAARAEKPSASNVYQQTRILVSGRILDSSGQPVPGASVIEKGTTNGVNTDIDGKFTISVKSGASLEVSCIGYETVSVAASENLSVTLREDTQFLDEVVVVGFGTQKKVNMTGSVAAVDVDKAFGSKPITDVSKGLQGVVPGLSITYNSNDLNASPTMKIRGTGSINGDNTPLILLDGVEVPDLSFVNPDNIKSISVLKDAASSSIYGSRAAWGVVLITSKDGSAVKDKVSITYSNNFSWNQPIGLPKYITDKKGVLAQLEEGMLAQKNVDGSRIEAFGMYYDTIGKGITTWFDKYSGNLSNPVYKYGEDYEFIEGTPYYYRVSDPNKEIFKTSFSQTHNLSVNGNTGKTNYNIGLGYTMNDGKMKQSTVLLIPPVFKRFAGNGIDFLTPVLSAAQLCGIQQEPYILKRMPWIHVLSQNLWEETVILTADDLMHDILLIYKMGEDIASKSSEIFPQHRAEISIHLFGRP